MAAATGWRHHATHDVGQPHVVVHEVRKGETERGRISLVLMENEFVTEVLDARSPNAENREHVASKVRAMTRAPGLESSPSWYGVEGNLSGKSIAEWAKDRQKNGWREGAERALRLADALRSELPSVQSVRRRPRWADDGDSLDVDKALAKQWDTAYRVTTRQVANAPQIVTIGVEYGGSALHQADDLFWAGAAGIALADILEEAGYQTEIAAVYGGATYAGLNKQCQYLRVKAASEPLQADSVAGIIASPGGFRVFGIIAIGMALDDVGYGFAPVESVKDKLAACEQAGLIPAVDVLLTRCHSEQDAKTQITKALQGLGARVNDEDEAEIEGGV